MKKLKNGMYFETVYYVVNEDNKEVATLSTYEKARAWIRERIIEDNDIRYGIVKVCKFTKDDYTLVKRFKVID